MSATAWTTIKDALHSYVVAGSGLAATRVMWAGQNAPEPSDTASAWISLRLTLETNPGNDWSDYDPRPLTFASKTITLVDPATDRITVTAHGLSTRDGPVRLTTTGSLTGTGLATGNDYWWITVDADKAQLATTFLNANTGTAIDITGTGSGTHSVVSTASTVKSGEELTEKARGARRLTLTLTCFPPLTATDATEATAILADIQANAGLSARQRALNAAGIGMSSFGPIQALDGVQNTTNFEPRAILTAIMFTTSEVQATETVMDYVTVQNEITLGTFTVENP